MTRTLRPIVFVFLAACGSESATPPASSGVASSKPSSAPLASASSSVKVAASSAPKKPPAPAKADTQSAVKHLTAGRKLAGKKDWKGAIAEYEEALKISPKDGRALGELGFAALQAGDLAKAKDANKRALAVASAPAQRAQILYNIGRVAEEEKDTAAAKAAYGESLSLRENKEVAKRFAGVGGKPEEIASSPTLCADGFDSMKELCACLVKKAPDFMILGDAGPKCEADPSPPSLGDARFSLVHMRADEGREDTHVLVSKDGKKLRAVAVLGSSYEPGAFGVHNEHSITGAEAKKEGSKSIVVLHHLEDDNDMNMGGMELCQHTVNHDTVCVLGDGDAATRCPITVPVKTVSGCTVGVEPDESTLSDEEKETIKQIKANEKLVEANTSYVIGEDGKITVKLESGDESTLPPKTAGEFVLWAK
ncbi:MAG: tetratricopeptide repeat protein [Polyangiaceae bacterium]